MLDIRGTCNIHVDLHEQVQLTEWHKEAMGSMGSYTTIIGM